MIPLLEVQNLQKKYGDHQVVKGINFEVNKGEVFGLLGPNGAGKTQTISMITGVIEPTAGTACVDGLDIFNEQKKVKQIIGLVPQDLALYPTLSARTNLTFFGRIYGLRGKELRERIEDVLHIVALTDRADEPVENYSGGMKRRVNIAAGLVHQPKLLFLDEPTVGVDPQSRNQIFESVMRLNKERGMSIIYTTHYMEEAQRLCHRVAIVDEGQIIALDTPKGLIKRLGGGILIIGIVEGRQEEVVDPIAQLPPVKSVTRLDNQLKIETHRLQEALICILDITNRRNVPITSIEMLEPNLESVFLHMTGKKLRE